MARISAQTAVPTLRQLAIELERCLREAGTLAGAPRFLEDLQFLVKESAERWIDVDVAVRQVSANGLVADWFGLAPPAPDSAAPVVVRAQGGFAGLRLHFWDIQDPPVHRAGTLFRPILVLVETCPGTDNGSAEPLVEDRPLVVALGKDTFPECASQCWRFEPADRATPVSATILGRLLSIPDDALREGLLASALANGIESLSTAFGLAIDTDLRNLKATKAVTQQRIAQLQRSSLGPVNEVSGEIRMRLQRRFVDFERGSAERMQNLFAPRTGTLTLAIEESLASVVSLEQERRSRSVSLRISESQEEGLLSLVREKLHAHLMADVNILHDLFRVVRDEITTYLDERNGPPVVPQFSHLSEERVQRVLDATVLLLRHYHGEVPRGGVFEHFLAARRYLTIVFMLISAFGLSFVRNYREFMIPASIVLLAGGALMVAHTVKRERAETNANEIEKACEHMRNEYRRMGTEIQRAWASLLGQHLTDQTQQVLYQIESALKDHSSRRSAEATEEKQRIQRQLQNLETTEKRLQSAAKTRGASANALSQIKGELRQLFPAGRERPAGAPG